MEVFGDCDVDDIEVQIVGMAQVEIVMIVME